MMCDVLNLTFAALVEVTRRLFQGNSWVNARTGKQIEVIGTHSDYLFDHPNLFGVRLPESQYWKVVYPYMFSLGWIRTIIASYGIFFQTNLTSEAKSTILEICAKALREKYDPSIVVTIDVGEPTERTIHTTLGAIVNEGYFESKKTFANLIQEFARLPDHTAGHYWVQTKGDNEVINVGSQTHYNAVARNPTRYGIGLPIEKMDLMIRNGKYKEVLNSAFKKGWLRVIDAWKFMFIQGDETPAARDTVLELLKSSYDSKKRIMLNQGYSDRLATVDAGLTKVTIEWPTRTESTTLKEFLQDQTESFIDLLSGIVESFPDLNTSGAWWITPSGQYLEVPSEHAYYVKNHSKELGIPDNILAKGGEAIWSSVIGDLGWIRLRKYRDRDNQEFWNLTVPNMSQRVKDLLWDWASRSNLSPHTAVWIDPFKSFRWGRVGNKTTIERILKDFDFGEGKSESLINESSYLNQLVKEFGRTDNPRLGGWILPEGDFLDLSAGGDIRGNDHRIINFVLKGDAGRFKGLNNLYNTMMHIARQARLIRWIPEGWEAELATEPTRAQVQTLIDLALQRKLVIDKSTALPGRFFHTYDADTADLIADDLRKYFGESKAIDEILGKSVESRKSIMGPCLLEDFSDVGKAWDYGGAWINSKTGEVYMEGGVAHDEVLFNSPIKFGAPLGSDLKTIREIAFENGWMRWWQNYDNEVTIETSNTRAAKDIIVELAAAGKHRGYPVSFEFNIDWHDRPYMETKTIEDILNIGESIKTSLCEDFPVGWSIQLRKEINMHGALYNNIFDIYSSNGLTYVMSVLADKDSKTLRIYLMYVDAKRNLTITSPSAGPGVAVLSALKNLLKSKFSGYKITGIRLTGKNAGHVIDRKFEAKRSFSSIIESFLREGAEEAWNLRAAWIHSKTGEVVPVNRLRDEEHVDVAYKNPEKFGRQSKEILRDNAFAFEIGWIRYWHHLDVFVFEGNYSKSAEDTVIEVIMAAANKGHRGDRLQIEWNGKQPIVTTIGEYLEQAA